MIIPTYTQIEDHVVSHTFGKGNTKIGAEKVLQTCILPRSWLQALPAMSRQERKATVTNGCPSACEHLDSCYVTRGHSYMSLVSHAKRISRLLAAGENPPLNIKGVGLVRGGYFGDPQVTQAVAMYHEMLFLVVAKPLGAEWRCYTANWRRIDTLKGLAMASCSSLEDARLAMNRGWTPFLSLPADQVRTARKELVSIARTRGAPAAAICPATLSTVTCSSCPSQVACTGANRPIVIGDH